MEPPRRVTVRSKSESTRCWRLPTPRELVAVVTVVLVVGNALVDYSSFAAFRPIVSPPPLASPLDTAAAATATQLWTLASSHLVEPRGIVLPLFDDIAVLGASLLLELRMLHVELPVEIPHCGDLSASFAQLLIQQNETLNVRIYDVCELAAAATDADDDPLFCEDLDACHRRFRSFDIKILALIFSRFQEVMLVDADVLFFQSPIHLWTLDKYRVSGTLFFPDRISATRKYLSRRVSHNRSRLHAFVASFDRSPYRHLETVPLANPTPRGEPSDYLRATHAWNLRAGHHADSSLLLWNKRQQPRATAILASFVTLFYAHRPPSYGDKELYFLACEVADAHYAFSDFGVGAIGWNADHRRGVLCGDIVQFYPIETYASTSNALYINSDHITSWNPDEQLLYRTKARPANHYPGSFEEQMLRQECPFDIEPTLLTPREQESFRRRQEWFKTLDVTWQTLEENVEEEEEEDEKDMSAATTDP